MRILLDTNICIYMIKNKPPEVRKHFEKYSIGDIGISTITIAELEYGVQKSKAKEKNSNALQAFLMPLEFLPFDDASARTYGKIRAELEQAGKPIGCMDMLIAAQAVAHNCILVTHNLKEFARIENLRCETWIK